MEEETQTKITHTGIGTSTSSGIGGSRKVPYDLEGGTPADTWVSLSSDISIVNKCVRVYVCACRKIVVWVWVHALSRLGFRRS